MTSDAALQEAIAKAVLAERERAVALLENSTMLHGLEMQRVMDAIRGE